MPTSTFRGAQAPTGPATGARRVAALGAGRASALALAVLAAHLGVAWAASGAPDTVPQNEALVDGPDARGAVVMLVGLRPSWGPAHGLAPDPGAGARPSTRARAADGAAQRPPAVESPGAALWQQDGAPAAAPSSGATAPRPPDSGPGSGAMAWPATDAAGPLEAAAAPVQPIALAGVPPSAVASSQRSDPAVVATAPGTGEASVPVPSPEPGPPRAPQVPVYPTVVPGAAALTYDLRRGVFSGTGALNWQPAGDRYRASLEGRIAGLTVLEWASEGRFDRAGLAPDRYVDRRRTGSRQAANFQREAGKVTYSGPSVEHPLVPGAQDRLSWMIQIAAIAQARPEAVAAGASVSMWVSGARGDADVWTFRSQGIQSLDLPGGTVPTVKLLRLPRELYDTRVEVWLDPARGHLPVRARLTSGRDDDVLELTLRRP